MHLFATRVRVVSYVGPPHPNPYAPQPVVRDPDALSPYVDPFRQRGHTLLVVVFSILAVVGVAGTFILSVSAGEPTGSGLALLYAMLPVPVLVGCFFWLDRYEPEPLRYKLAAFVWGGVVAVAIALVIQVAVGQLWDPSTTKMATFVAPMSEEPAKCAFLLLTFVRSRRPFDGFVDAFVYAGLVGLGFAFVENVGYYAGSYVGDPDIKLHGAEGATATFIVRGIFSPFAHPLFTSAFALAVAWALMIRSRVLKVLVCVLGLATSMVLHGAWNGSLSYGGPGAFLVTYLVLAVLFGGLIAAACLARVRQGRQLVVALQDVARRGWIHADEVPYLARLPYRKQARKFATAHAGKLAGKAVRRYQRLAAEMAFLYDGAMRGRPKPQAVPRVRALIDAMGVVKPFVVLPPPLRQAPRPPTYPPPPGVHPPFAPGYAPPYAPPGAPGHPPPYPPPGSMPHRH